MALFFEDFRPGDVTDTASVTVTREEIVAFARQFDPQPFHVDEEAARRSPYGGLIASGWHTAALCMRLVVELLGPGSGSLGSPGVDELRWLKPVRPGDELSVHVEVKSAEGVNAVLTSDICRVRPPAEPVPQALLGSSTADIFRRLVRMNDGPGQQSLKHAVTTMLESMDASGSSHEWARRLPAEPDEIAFRLPAYVIGSLLGVPADDLPRLADLVGDFAPALAPGSLPEQVERGREAAVHLLDLFRALPGAEDDAIVANRIGFLFQAYDSTAGLIDNTLLALAKHPEADVHQALLNVLRYDPPVQNTRRFVVKDGIVAGRGLKEGNVVLVVLAAANRDPAGKLFTFGAGPHVCPGETLAITIAQAGIEALLRAGVDLKDLAENVTYRPSANCRIPVLAS